MDMINLFKYCEKDYSNIATSQLYINEDYHDKVLTIIFYADNKVLVQYMSDQKLKIVTGHSYIYISHY